MHILDFSIYYRFQGIRIGHHVILKDFEIDQHNLTFSTNTRFRMLRNRSHTLEQACGYRMTGNLNEKYKMKLFSDFLNLNIRQNTVIYNIYIVNINFYVILSTSYTY